MQLIKRLKGFLPTTRKSAARQARKYAAAQINRLHLGWITQPSLIDQDIRGGLTTMRARSREEAQNNGYFKGFLRDLKENVIGSQGIQLISRPMATETEVDSDDKKTIERHWKNWGKKENRPEVSGMSFKTFLKLVINSCAQDGECFIWERKGSRFNNYRYSVRVMEPGSIDVQKNEELPNGNVVRMGVEYDENRFPVAYHVLASERDLDFFISTETGRRYIRIPSDEIIHLYLHDGIWQTRGVPWIHPALLRFNTLDKYEEAELVASRAGASKMGFIIDGPDGSGYTGDSDEEDEDYLYEELEPGLLGRLKSGQQFEGFDPQHPNAIYPSFVKINLRGIAAALGESYNQFAQDLEGVSFGSLRQGALSERAVWMGLQEWLIEEALDRIFSGWLFTSLLAGAITNHAGQALPLERFDKFVEHEWQPRRWDWIDPLKDTTADHIQTEDLVMSKSERIRKRGRQPDDVFEEISSENKKLAALGITSAQVGAKLGDESADDRLLSLECAVADLEELAQEPQR